MNQGQNIKLVQPTHYGIIGSLYINQDGIFWVFVIQDYITITVLFYLISKCKITFVFMHYTIWISKNIKNKIGHSEKVWMNTKLQIKLIMLDYIIKIRNHCPWCSVKRHIF